MFGTIRADYTQLRRRWRVDSSNVRYFDALVRGQGEVFTLDVRPYVALLTDFGIFFTAPRREGN
jgi:hypothetical protein